MITFDSTKPADLLQYDDLKHAVDTIDREIETLEILKGNLDGNLSKALFSLNF